MNQKVFLVYNPKAGEEDQLVEIQSAIGRYFTSPSWSIEIYQTTGKEDVTAICRAACEGGASIVVSAGGDGTLVSVANALVKRKIPLGILPLGTGNLLARVLNVPLKLDQAVQLLAGEHTIATIDVLKAGDRYYFSNVGVGISPVIMKETKTEQKKRLGFLAYIITIVKQSRLFRRHRYMLTFDGQSRRLRASEILVANTTFFEKATMPYGPPETLMDGQIEVYVATAKTLSDYLRLVQDLFRGMGQPGAKLYHLESLHNVRIEAIQAPQLVQADGEVIGYTPVEVEIVPQALHVISPIPADE